ncbi:AmmeMemoRadiSam system protein A [Candidatus Margulisiibacteriota bacterium]
MIKMHPLVDLAVKAVNTFVKEGNTISPPAILSDEMRGKAGVFVSLHKGESLRGCIGTTAATRANVAEEIIVNAISAATRDPRFPPVTKDELPGLTVKVDVLGGHEKIDDISQLDAKKYGVIVVSGGKKGLLLPDLEGVSTPEQQIEICKKKAWISEGEPLELYRFQVKRYH